jgi:hypothetical protein
VKCLAYEIFYKNNSYKVMWDNMIKFCATSLSKIFFCKILCKPNIRLLTLFDLVMLLWPLKTLVILKMLNML